MSNKVNNLQQLINDYNTKKNEYIEALKLYKDSIKQTNNNQINSTSANSISENKLITRGNVVMTTDNNTFDISINNNEFYSNIKYQGDTSGKIYSDQFIQMDLDMLKQMPGNYDSNHLYKANDSAAFEESSTDGCTETVFDRCDGYAKMNNQNYYGVVENSNNNCECHVFENVPTIESGYMLNKTNVMDVSMNYFGVMMNGGLYYLTDDIYSNNFKDLYHADDNKTKIVKTIDNDEGLKLTSHNPFTGRGPNRLTINSFNTANCQ